MNIWFVNVLRTSLIGFLAFSPHGCGGRKTSGHGPTEFAPSSTPEFVGINFQPGRPLEHEALADAIAEPRDFFLNALERDRRVLEAFPNVKFRAVGHTDSMECNDKDCAALSLRRAEYVRMWMIESGIPSEIFKKSKGYGASMPIEENATEEGRLANRRAGISFID